MCVCLKRSEDWEGEGEGHRLLCQVILPTTTNSLYQFYLSYLHYNSIVGNNNKKP